MADWRKPWPPCLSASRLTVAVFLLVTVKAPRSISRQQKFSEIQFLFVLLVDWWFSNNTLFIKKNKINKRWVQWWCSGSWTLLVFTLASQSGTYNTWAARWRQLIAINLCLDKKPSSSLSNGNQNGDPLTPIQHFCSNAPLLLSLGTEPSCKGRQFRLYFLGPEQAFHCEIWN